MGYSKQYFTTSFEVAGFNMAIYSFHDFPLTIIGRGQNIQPSLLKSLMIYAALQGSIRGHETDPRGLWININNSLCSEFDHVENGYTDSLPDIQYEIMGGIAWHD